jgi:hypothetical protein
MRDPRLLENRSLLDKAQPPVKRCRMRLGMKQESLQSQLPCTLDERPRQRCSDAAATPFTEHGHSSQPAVRQQSCGADASALFIKRHRVLAGLVPFVPFELPRDVLFFDEHALAHRARRRYCFAPGNYADFKGWLHRFGFGAPV